jgi:hypothetical protein
MASEPLKVFISYNRADRDWAEWIAGTIETAGYKGGWEGSATGGFGKAKGSGLAFSARVTSHPIRRLQRSMAARPSGASARREKRLRNKKVQCLIERPRKE